jgi:hypothetical protein
LPCALFPGEGIVMTEIEALEILSGVKAIPIAAGGLAGAEGAITLVLKGEPEQVRAAIGHVENSKGARLPQVRTPNCDACSLPACRFPPRDKHWV